MDETNMPQNLNTKTSATMKNNSNNFYVNLSILMSVLSFVDGLYHLKICVFDDPNVNTNIIEANHTKRMIVIGLLAVKITLSILYVVLMIIKKERINNFKIYATIFHCIGSSLITMFFCTLLLFNQYPLSLIVHVLTIYAVFLTFLNLIFYKNQIDSEENANQNPLMTVFLWKIKQNLMALGTFGSVAVAILFGILIRRASDEWSPRQIMYLGFIGELFLRILKCLVLPLIFSSLVFAIGNMDSRLSSKVAGRALVYYFTTTFIAIITGIVLVISIGPGNREKAEIDHPQHHIQTNNLTTMDTVLDLFRNIFPDNIIQATFQYYMTSLTCVNQTDPICAGNTTDMSQWEIGSTMKNSANILGVVMFAIMFGAMMNKITEQQIMVKFFKGLNEVIMAMTSLMIQMTPVAVTFLILPQIIQVKDLSVLFGATGYYSLTVLVGIFIHGFITLPLIYAIWTRNNPFVVLKHLLPALTTAFGTSSSSATMPLTIECLEEKAHLDSRIVRFCIPVGATMNMDGTALYEAVAAIFISQYRQKSLSLIQIIIVSITSTAASIGAAGIPQAGLITMVIVLNAVGLDAHDIVLIIVVDWFLDRFRTVLNVIGDALGAALVDQLSKNDMDQIAEIDIDSTL